VVGSREPDVPGEDLPEAIWLTVGGVGVAPKPDVIGPQQASAEAVGYVARHAWARVGGMLGLKFAAPAFVIAEQSARATAADFRRGRTPIWPAAIVWLVAEDDELVGNGLLVHGGHAGRHSGAVFADPSRHGETHSCGAAAVTLRSG
jgi:hypothetical protein